jgi:hypothetical protein
MNYVVPHKAHFRVLVDYILTPIFNNENQRHSRLVVERFTKDF